MKRGDLLTPQTAELSDYSGAQTTGLTSSSSVWVDIISDAMWAEDSPFHKYRLTWSNHFVVFNASDRLVEKRAGPRRG